MSLARTALRLAVVAAFNADPAIDALCFGRVYDSRIGDMASDEPVPVITVFTEDDAGDAFSANDGGPPFDEKCDLLIEIAMRATLPAEGGGLVVGLVESDRQLEALIDLLELRCVEAVTVADTAASRMIRKAVTRRVTSFKSMRFASDETSVKLAIRMLHLTVQLKGDDPDVAGTGEFALLPDPLRTVAQSLPSGSGRDTCLKLVDVLAGTTPVRVPLAGVDITLAPRVQIDPASPPPSPGDPIRTVGVTATPASL